MVKGLTIAGILNKDTQLFNELSEKIVSRLKNDNEWILKKIKLVIFEYIVLLDRYII